MSDITNISGINNSFILKVVILKDDAYYDNINNMNLMEFNLVENMNKVDMVTQ